MIIPILLLFNVNLSGFVMDNLSGIGSEVTMYLCKESFYVFEKNPRVDRTMVFLIKVKHYLLVLLVLDHLDRFHTFLIE